MRPLKVWSLRSKSRHAAPISEVAETLSLITKVRGGVRRFVQTRLLNPNSREQGSFQGISRLWRAIALQ